MRMASAQDPSSVHNLMEPRSRRLLTTREKIIVLESSKLHECVFAPWSTAPDTSEFTIGDTESAYLDDTDLHLSDQQRDNLDNWLRPEEIVGNKYICQKDSPENSKKLLDLVQDITTDCSVVASLCAIISRADRGHRNLLAGVFHPWDEARQSPGISHSGKYVLRFYFNGSNRRVIIDDRLPKSKTDRNSYVVDRNDATTIWPALVEKAYLKVRGGYDFPGSNSGTDIWVLTGWIPEQLFLQRYALLVLP